MERNGFVVHIPRREGDPFAMKLVCITAADGVELPLWDLQECWWNTQANAGPGGPKSFIPLGKLVQPRRSKTWFQLHGKMFPRLPTTYVLWNGAQGPQGYDGSQGWKREPMGEPIEYQKFAPEPLTDSSMLLAIWTWSVSAVGRRAEYREASAVMLCELVDRLADLAGKAGDLVQCEVHRCVVLQSKNPYIRMMNLGSPREWNIDEICPQGSPARTELERLWEQRKQGFWIHPIPFLSSSVGQCSIGEFVSVTLLMDKEMRAASEPWYRSMSGNAMSIIASLLPAMQHLVATREGLARNQGLKRKRDPDLQIVAPASLCCTLIVTMLQSPGAKSLSLGIPTFFLLSSMMC